MTERRVRVVVIGDVQGVGFRWFTRDRAQARGIRGWVRNLPDGNVEVHAEGAANDVQLFLDDLRRGPPRSRVTNLQISDQAASTASEAGFEIVR